MKSYFGHQETLDQILRSILDCMDVVLKPLQTLGCKAGLRPHLRQQGLHAVKPRVELLTWKPRGGFHGCIARVTFILDFERGNFKLLALYISCML